MTHVILADTFLIPGYVETTSSIGPGYTTSPNILNLIASVTLPFIIKVPSGYIIPISLQQNSKVHLTSIQQLVSENFKLFIFFEKKSNTLVVIYFIINSN